MPKSSLAVSQVLEPLSYCTGPRVVPRPGSKETQCVPNTLDWKVASTAQVVRDVTLGLMPFTRPFLVFQKTSYQYFQPRAQE